MPETTRLDQFRLALSYLERIEGELAHWTKLRADNLLARTKYDEVRARYDQHVGRAKRLVSDMRHDAKRDVYVAESLVDGAKASQKKLIKLAARGGQDPAKLNERSRAASAKLAQTQSQLEEIRAILEAKTTGDLGGGIDLPLEEYPRRLDLLPPPPRLTRSRLSELQSNLLSAVVMLALVLGTVGAIYFWRSAPRATFRIEPDQGSGGFIEVNCTNTGNRPLFLYAPWPNANSEPLPGVSERSNSWGITLKLQLEGESDFRVYEDADGLWKMRGTYVEGGEPVSVRGGSTARLFLDLDKLRATGLNPSSIVIECTEAGGSVLARSEIDLAFR